MKNLWPVLAAQTAIVPFEGAQETALVPFEGATCARNVAAGPEAYDDSSKQDAVGPNAERDAGGGPATLTIRMWWRNVVGKRFSDRKPSADAIVSAAHKRAKMSDAARAEKEHQVHVGVLSKTALPREAPGAQDQKEMGQT